MIRVFFSDEFSPLFTEKKGLEIPRKGVLRFFFFLISFLKEKKKKLEVARFRQCVPLGRQN